MNEHFAVFDLETTGFSPTEDEIIQIAWVVVMHGTIIGSNSYVVKATEKEVSEDITRLTGLTQSDVDHGAAVDSVLSAFAYGTKGLPLIGHNVFRFDALFLEEVFAKFPEAAPGIDKGRYIDTAALYKGLKLGIDTKSMGSHQEYARTVLGRRVPGLKYNLQACCAGLDIDVSEIRFHEALGDVRATLAVYQKLTELGVTA